MRIGFDLDKVFVNTPPLIPDVIIERLYKAKSNGVLLYRIPKRPGQLIRRVGHTPFLRPVIQENIAFLRSINRQEHSLYLISSRFGFLEDITERLVKRLGLDTVFTHIYFNYDNKQPHLYKNAIIKKLRLDRYVDDDLRLLQFVAAQNKQTRFFWLNPKKDNISLAPNITAITSLKSVLS